MKCKLCGVDHRGQCHHCKHYADVRAGRFAKVEYSSTPCASCAIPSEHRVSHHGRIIPLDDEHDVAAQTEPEVNEQHVEVFARFMRTLWVLS